MNHIDVNKAQFSAYGNQLLSPPKLEQGEISLFRSLVSEMARNGKYEEAIKLLVDTIEELQNEIKEMKK